MDGEVLNVSLIKSRHMTKNIYINNKKKTKWKEKYKSNDDKEECWNVFEM